MVGGGGAPRGRGGRDLGPTATQQKGSSMRLLVLGFLALLCLASPAAFAAAPDPATDDQKTLYALGLAMSQSLTIFTLTESELEFVKAGLTDGTLKRPPKVQLQAYGPKIQLDRKSVV